MGSVFFALSLFVSLACYGGEACNTSVAESALRTSATIDFYNQEGAAAYDERTRKVDLSPQYAEFLALLPPGARILDAGCGAGRDSEYFKSKGLGVVAYDGTESMVRYTSERLKQPVLHLDFESLRFTTSSTESGRCLPFCMRHSKN